MFGARRFELGPTGIYGALARNNLISPEFRLEVKPSDRVDAFFAYRAAWLASDTDIMATALLRDSTGHSGSFIGHQFEFRVRARTPWPPLGMEFGGAYLDHGRFLRDAPGSVSDGLTAYGFLQATVTF